MLVLSSTPTLAVIVISQERYKIVIQRSETVMSSRSYSIHNLYLIKMNSLVNRNLQRVRQIGRQILGSDFRHRNKEKKNMSARLSLR